MRQRASPKYKNQACALTVSEALDEFYARNPDAIRATGVSAKDNFFRSHDTIHVVFGCDTTLQDEALADFWTIFGTDLGFRNYLKYVPMLQEDLKDIFRDIGYGRAILQTLKAIPKMAVVYWRSRQMLSKWRWQDHEDMLRRPLNELRQDLNIRVID